MKKIKFLIILILLNISCKQSKNDIENYLLGSWAIKKIEYKEQNLNENILSMNVIRFKKANLIRLPRIDNYLQEDNAEWELKYSDEELSLVIECANTYLKGFYKARIIKNNNSRLDILYLDSENTKIELRKL